MSVICKEKRIEFRLPEDAKRTIERAARVTNNTLSSYILSIVLKQAKLDLEQNEIITLSNNDRDKLMNALENTPEPNIALKGLFKI